MEWVIVGELNGAAQDSGSITQRLWRKVARRFGAAPQTPEEIALLTLRLRERSVVRSQAYPGHHKLFETFAPRMINCPEGHTASYLGQLWPAKFGLPVRPGEYETPMPAISEEYFEFLDVFESVLDADDTYTVMEWGAGFGRWTGLAIGAARLRGVKTIKAALCEAEPVHASWIREYMASLQMSPSDYRLFEVAMSGSAGEVMFMIDQPQGANPTDWYGQAIGGFDPSAFQPNGETYHGYPVVAEERGWKGIYVPLVPASKILEDYDFVDLIDMDIQGAEADAVEECIELLNSRVRRMHIGTHSREIEVRLRDVLLANGWILIRDLQCLGSSSTPFGEVECGDGVQSWFNPRFPPKNWMRGLPV
jgi:FkbM family methyltransferase